MKKILLILSILAIFPVYSFEIPNIFQTECFQKESTIDSPQEETIKIRSDENTLFPIQDNQLLNYKLLSQGSNKHILYEVLDYPESEQKKFSAIQDGNFNTVYYFDMISSNQKTIKIKLSKPLKAGKFKTQFIFSGYDKIEYYISQDNSKYIKVKEYSLTDYDFQYLKIIFQDKNEINRTQITELRFMEKVKDTYLINSKSNSPIHIYVNNVCDIKKNYRDFLTEYYQSNHKTNFSIDINTKKYDLDFDISNKYNNDLDNDKIPNNQDNCPYMSNNKQEDIDKDLIGDVCDFDNEIQNYFDQDYDNDGIGDGLDNCKYIYNPDQKDRNANNIGDVCADDDRDGVMGYLDNCPNLSNRDQTDKNINGIGDACEMDKDDDKVFDSIDNCITDSNPDQADADKDRIGDVCDNCKLYNPDQADKDNNGIGDICEQEEEYVEKNDKDEDGIVDYKDNCELVSNPEQEDTDRDLIGDACDNCPNFKNPKQEDKNENGVGDWCEDIDEDGLIGLADNCIWNNNEDQKDDDNNGIGNVCEDKDFDEIVAIDDNCPLDYNVNQLDIDGDGIGDACDKSDDRYVESNKEFFIIIMVLVTIIFGVGIGFMVRKLR